VVVEGGGAGRARARAGEGERQMKQRERLSERRVFLALPAATWASCLPANRNNTSTRALECVMPMMVVYLRARGNSSMMMTTIWWWWWW